MTKLQIAVKALYDIQNGKHTFPWPKRLASEALTAIEIKHGLADDTELVEAVACHIRLMRELPVEMVAHYICRHIDEYQKVICLHVKNVK